MMSMGTVESSYRIVYDAGNTRAVAQTTNPGTSSRLVWGGRRFPMDTIARTYAQPRSAG